MGGAPTLNCGSLKKRVSSVAVEIHPEIAWPRLLVGSDAIICADAFVW